jgi:hypothetical protein
MSATAVAGGATDSLSPAAVTTTRELLIVSIAVVLLVVAWPLRKLLIGQDKRLSTSKTTAAAWTSLLAGSLLGMVIAKFAGHSEALEEVMHSGVAGQYGLLIGGPLGAAIAAKGIVGKQVEKNSAAKTPAAGAAHPLQLVNNDTGEADLGDFQYVLFNLVAIVYFVGTLMQSPLAGLPHIPDVLLGLTSVSAVGYVAKKALPPGAPTAKISPATAAAKATVTITGTGLLDDKEPEQTAVTVLFGTVCAETKKKERVDGTDSITAVVPDGLDTEVDVLVVTPNRASVSAGSFKLK